MKVVEDLKVWAGRLKTELYALYLAYRDPRVPLYARVFAACVVGYAFSPIDLIPDPRPRLPGRPRAYSSGHRARGAHDPLERPD